MKKTAREKSNKDNYEYLAGILWEEVIMPSIKQFMEENSALDLHTRGMCKLRIKFILLFNYYSKLVLNEYMIDSKRIDRHKIASISLKVIKKIKPFKLTFGEKCNSLIKKTSLPEKKILANEWLGLRIAYKIVNAYIKSNPKLFHHKLIVPEPFPRKTEAGFQDGEAENEQYLKNYCSDLYFNDGMDVLTHANIFFLLEKYSCRKTQCDNLEKECRRLLKTYEHLSDNELTSKINEIRFQEH